MKKKIKDAHAPPKLLLSRSSPMLKSPAHSAFSWADLAPVSGGGRRLSLAIAVTGSFLCLYALLIIFTSHPCWNSFHCRSLICGGGGGAARPAPYRGAVETSPTVLSVLPQNEGQKREKIASSSTNYTPLSLPSQGRAFATIPSITTNLSHIVFGIAASSRLWNKRKEYIKLWWRADRMRGFVWLDQSVKKTDWDNSLPPLKISQNITRFKYTNKLGRRSAIRISRIVSETFRLGLPDIHWFVMGDDDTLFIPENLVRVLSKYDHRQYYYIGSNSESHLQNLMFSYNMAYGGGGFAISYPLAKALEKIQDKCLERYPSLFGSDDRIQACMAELGVPLTKETGFHQYDVYGNLFGLLAAHPVAPVVSLHHLDVLEPIFPNRTRVKGLHHLRKSIRADTSGFLQQSLCYDTKRQWSISVSWGFAVQIYRGIFPARELEMPIRTFYNWHRRADYTAYAFNTRAMSRHPCQKPIVFYMTNVSSGNSSGWIQNNFRKTEPWPPSECKWKMESPEMIDSVQVMKQRDDTMWSKGPRRKCCRVVPPVTKSSDRVQILVRDCELGEIAAV